MEHWVKVVIAILGALLAGIAVVGKKRLKRWNIYAILLLRRERVLRRRVLKSGGRAIRILIHPLESAEDMPDFIAVSFGILMLLSMGGFILVTGITFVSDLFHIHLPTWLDLGLDIYGLVGGGILALPLAWAIFLWTFACVSFAVTRTLFVCCWLVLAPYELVRLDDRDEALERTFMRLGVALIIVGIILLA
jgi:hypothetical protein